MNGRTVSIKRRLIAQRETPEKLASAVADAHISRNTCLFESRRENCGGGGMVELCLPCVHWNFFRVFVRRVQLCIPLLLRF